jgi:putative transposase
MVNIQRAYKVELKSNNRQRTAFLKHAGTARFAYNWGLEQKIAHYKETGKSLSYPQLHKMLNTLKKTDFPWMHEVSKCAPQEALRNLDKAFKNFFRRLKNGEKSGFPKFKSRGRGIGSFRLTGAIHVNHKWIQLPRIGKVRLKERGYLPENRPILSATVSERAGHWFVSVLVEELFEPQIRATGEVIGVDLGIKELAVVSDGRIFPNPKALGGRLKQLKRLQRQLSRKQKGSKNRTKAKTRLARLHYRISCIRQDVLHKATTSITARTKPEWKRPSAVGLEDLNIAGMLKNHKLAMAIADVGLGEFNRQMEYKSLWSGVKIHRVDRFYPSSKICSRCGYIKDTLFLSERVYRCEECGFEVDRDLNAALNLRNEAAIYFKQLGIYSANTVSSTEIHACGEDVRPDFGQATLAEAGTGPPLRR